MASKTNKYEGDRSGAPNTDDEEDYERDYVQFSRPGGLSASEIRHMEAEDRERDRLMAKDFAMWDRSQGLPAGVTGFLLDGKIVNIPKRSTKNASFAVADAARAGRSSPRGEKDLCEKCGCMVVLEDHEARCAAPVPADREESDKLRRMAWLGDAEHSLDVRRFLVVTGVGVADLEVKSQVFRSHAARARYYRANPGVMSVPGTEGRSDAALANLFNASYVGEYRKQYLRKVLSVGSKDVVFPGYLAPHFKGGFPYP